MGCTKYDAEAVFLLSNFDREARVSSFFIVIHISANKILLNPPLEKGEEEKVLPFLKGSQKGF
jgi:hypothetical protein